MKPCDKHFDALRRVLQVKNLWRLVGSLDAESTRRRARAWLAGEAGPGDVDPLIISILELNQKAVTFIGPRVNLPGTGGQPQCALCEAQAAFRNESIADAWIDNCTDAVLIFVKVNDL